MDEIADINPSSNIPDRFYYIDLESVTSGRLTSLKVIEKKDAPSRAQRLVLQNDILYQTVRPYQQNNYLATDEFDLPAVASTGYAQIRTKHNSQFLYSLLHTNRFLQEVLLRCTGSNYPAINSNDLKEITVYFPSCIEQDKIALFMALIDRRIEKQRQLVEALKSYKRGVLQSIFSGSSFCGKTAEKWAKKSIAEIFDCIIDKGHPEADVLTIIQGLGTTRRDAGNRRISYDKSTVATYKKVVPNDFILHLRSFEGGLEIANETGVVSPAYTILRSKYCISPQFYYAYFRSYAFIKGKLRTAVEGIRDGKSINMDTFWKITIPSPPLEEQERFAKIFAGLDTAINQANIMLDKLDILKRGLLDKLFI